MASLWWDGLKLREVIGDPMACVAVISAWSPLTTSRFTVPSSPPVYNTFLCSAMWLNSPDVGMNSGLHISIHKHHKLVKHRKFCLYAARHGCLWNHYPFFRHCPSACVNHAQKSLNSVHYLLHQFLSNHFRLDIKKWHFACTAKCGQLRISQVIILSMKLHHMHITQHCFQLQFSFQHESAAFCQWFSAASTL